MKLKRIFIFSALIFAVILSALVSCGEKAAEPGPPDEELIARLNELAPLSFELNEIFFGKGIPAIDKAVLSEYDIGAQYFEVAYDAAYREVAALKDAASGVYSSGYLESIFLLAFDGSAEDEISPRYKDVGGVLYVDIAYKSLDIRTVIDLSSAVVTESTPTQAKIKVNYTLDGDSANTGTMTLVLVNQDGVWLLDAPTF